MLNKTQKKKGISLIVLVITIIVMIILATTIIISLNNNGIINTSNEAVFKTNVKGYQEELSLYLGNRLSEDTKYNSKSLNADTTTSPSITEVIESMKEEDKTEFIVQKGKLVYIGKNEEKIGWCGELGIETKKLALTEAEYNEIYKDEIEIALKYGTVTNGVYTLKYEYNWNANGNTVLPTDVTTLVLPYGVKEIESYAFWCQFNLKKVIVPETLTSIGYKAFSACGITDIDLPNNLTTIENQAFMGSRIRKIELPESLTSLGESVFEDSLLTSIKIPSKIKNIPANTFAGCESLTSVELPDGIISIEVMAFARCTNLSKIQIPEGVTTIGSSAFNGCKSLNNLTLPNSVKTIGNSAFYGANIKKVNIPNSITTLDDYLFGSATIENIIIPKSVVTIISCAFEQATIGTVYYEGTEEEWNNIDISEVANTAIINAKKVYNYAD